MKDDHNRSDEDLYKDFLNETKEEMENSYTLSEDEQQQIIQTGRSTARLTNVMISLAVLLLILPAMTLLTYMYYGIGGKANELIDVVSKTIYVTEPNMSLEEMELEEDIGVFSMHLLFDVYKRIGKEDYKAEDYDIYFALDKPGFPKKNYFLDRPLPDIPTLDTGTMLHPKAPVPFHSTEDWDMLGGLPDGTVAEVYLSFNELMEPNQLEKALPDETELRWLAVDTGLEVRRTDKEGVPIAPIGYPAQTDTTTWSPFHGREQTNDEVFMDILKLLEDNEDVAEKVARAKSLEVKERRAYVQENGIKIYGAVVTGPTPELRKLEQMKEVRAVKVGEVKLWNWK